VALFSNLNNYKNFGLLIIRIGLGAMFIYHGLPKLTGGEKVWIQLGNSTKYIGIHFWPAVWGLLCAIVETFGGFLFLIGLEFRIVCLLLIINMAVAAASQYLGGGGLSDAAHAIEDAVTFAGLLFVGPGRYSVDKK